MSSIKELGEVSTCETDDNLSPRFHASELTLDKETTSYRWPARFGDPSAEAVHGNQLSVRSALSCTRKKFFGNRQRGTTRNFFRREVSGQWRVKSSQHVVADADVCRVATRWAEDEHRSQARVSGRRDSAGSGAIKPIDGAGNDSGSERGEGPDGLGRETLVRVE